ncbi:threonine synthase [Dongia rigui]|uniref:Threonine synthase n=1 Tax=Dongia rigui TaxID=940149 RepID=A0ABU5DVR7_9PROT|nr:threonine synthase [Dongia rigui]MDY0871388.1 threonine synthase [Dongia rigui]
MRYISTRGQAPKLNFEAALLTGLARDGGLYVPETWPQWSAGQFRKLAGKPYEQVAAAVTKPFIGSSLKTAQLDKAIAAAYGTFRHQAVAPLVQVDESLWLMELFHGPTLAFKDVALQLLGQLYDIVLKERGERITVVGATSGDTGSAALEACKNRQSIDIFILHPKGRVSDVQRRQMTTIEADNIHNIAIDGSFDDCQDMVKAMFNDPKFRDRVNMSAVNSINWARVMAQIVYYVTGALALGAPDRAVNFAVPSGNFGNVFAGYAARAMGLPIDQLIVGSNRNDILTRFFNSGAMKMSKVAPSLSPSMDIQVSSNLERLLFDLFDRQGKKLGQAMTDFRETGSFAAPKRGWAATAKLFKAYKLDDRETLAAMRDVHKRTGMLVDPHSAIGLAAALEARISGKGSATPTIALATAHPAKFPDAVEKATGIRPALPAHLADLLSRKERLSELPNDLGKVQDYVLAHTRLGHNR